MVERPYDIIDDKELIPVELLLEKLLQLVILLVYDIALYVALFIVTVPILYDTALYVALHIFVVPILHEGALYWIALLCA